MITDKFLFREAEKILDKIESIASCYEFQSKEVLRIRLLAEEIISVISPVLAVSDGRCWISTDEKSFSVTIDCDAGVNGLGEAVKNELIKIGRGGKKKGIFGMINKALEFLSVPDIDYGLIAGHRMICAYGMETGMYGYYWNPEFADVWEEIKSEQKQPEQKPEENKSGDEDGHAIEMSIIEGYADDIHVSLEKGKGGVRLRITASKHFAPGQTEKIVFYAAKSGPMHKTQLEK